ncbi:MAG: dihydroorotate dehydrogenase electron transfer subunit [Deltaproteobacteria bacterium]|nr:dihydroorotate dehydrogenase electron transfer subunit [Deltaproteobacteria bacterium]
MPGVYLIRLDCPDITSQARPGQFVMARCGEGPEYQLRRPLSIHQIDGNKLSLLFNVVGRGTRWLSECPAGEKLDLLGVLGNGYEIYPDSRNLLLAAGGIGIAPLVFLAGEAIRRGKDVTLLLGVATAGQLYPSKLLPAGVRLVTATEDGSGGEKGMITDLLPDFINGADQVFACGPLPMYRNMAQIAELKDNPVQISLEVRMGCGLGVCYGCTVKTRNGLRQVCKDGPIFNLDDVLWDKLADI